jgi:hypothetical protein
VKRPDFGTAGKNLAIYVNAFVTSIPEDTIRHYDGKIIFVRFPYVILGFTQL